jgi:hypothetical protein
MARKRRADGTSGEREKPFETQGKRSRMQCDGLLPEEETEPKMSLNYQIRGYHSD